MTVGSLSMVILEAKTYTVQVVRYSSTCVFTHQLPNPMVYLLPKTIVVKGRIGSSVFSTVANHHKEVPRKLLSQHIITMLSRQFVNHYCQYLQLESPSRMHYFQVHRSRPSSKSLVQTKSWYNTRCLKIKEKVSFNIASEASQVYILSGQKFIKKAKNGPFWRAFGNLKLEVKQCYQTGQF